MTFAVESSAIESMAYDTDIEELTVVYAGGGEYRYVDVPFNVATAAADADSVGRYVNENIKGKYESYDPAKRLTKETLLAVVAAADELNKKVDELTEGMLYTDPAKNHILKLQGALDTYANRLENLANGREAELC